MTLPETMGAMVLTGHGGLDRLEWREDVPVPRPRRGEVLIRVAASSVNNTDINTRTAWYSKTVRADTATAARADGGHDADAAAADGGWSGRPIAFPRIQGADCVGRIVAVGENVPHARIGERVMVRALQSTGAGDGPCAVETFGSDHDGGFAEYARTFAADALPVDAGWSDIELATIPCAYSTAEGMLHRANVGHDERVLITGASGGVGSAAVQLARRRGARITAMTAPGKAGTLCGLGADATVGRDGTLEPDSFDCVVDLVAGQRWGDMIGALRRGGRYVTAGAIAGPIVELDVRTLYLRDLTLYGSTYQPGSIMTDLIGYIERGEIRPNVAAVYPLAALAEAQRAFLDKAHVGKIAIAVAAEADRAAR